MAIVERFVLRALTQVTKYLTDDAIRAAARDSVLKLIDSRTRVVIGHSLGSIVAYEACFSLENRLPLLLTIGSPLGLRTIVYERLRPQPPIFPSSVDGWVNLADPDDLVAADTDLGTAFPRPSGGPVVSVTVKNGADAHDPRPYLTSMEAGRAVGQSLATS
jgi:hypothetical protein